MYIVIEGIDTAGKSTQINLLKDRFSNTIFTKEPGGTKIGLEIRDIILNKGVNSKLAELFLFLADRAEHIENIIKPNQDKTIISDRSLISGIAYADNNLSINELIKLNLLAIDSILPDKIVMLTLNKDILQFRLSQKEEDKIEARGIDYLLNIQDRFLKIIKLLNRDYIIIDASKDMENIHKEIINFLQNHN